MSPRQPFGENLPLPDLQTVIVLQLSVVSRLATSHSRDAMLHNLDLIQKIPGVKWWRTSKATRCQTCKEILFAGRPDPLEKYWAGLGGWYGEPIAVCLGSWRNWWQRKWYHQICCGVDMDRSNLAGLWQVFGFAPSEIQQYRIRASRSPDSLSAMKVGPSYPAETWQRLPKPSLTFRSNQAPHRQI